MVCVFVQESLDIFDVIVNNNYFINVSIILFLNKSDLLEEKVAHGVLISDYFPDFEGDPQSLCDVQNYLVYRYLFLLNTALKLKIGRNILVFFEENFTNKVFISCFSGKHAGKIT